MIWLLLLLVGGGTFYLFRMMSQASRSDVLERLERFTSEAMVSVQEEKEEAKKEDFFDNLDKRFAKQPRTVKLAQDLVKADMPLRVTEYYAIRAVMSTLGALLGYLFMGLTGTILFFIPTFFFMPFYVKRRQKQRQKAFADQLENALSMISNGLKAGYSFMQCVDLVAKEMPPPISSEFQRLLRETMLGMDIENSLTKLSDRMESDDFSMVVTTVLIQRQTGGNLAEILDNIAGVIRERVKLKGEVRALTAMGRMSGGVIGCLPIGIGVMIYFLLREEMMLMFTKPVGWAMLFAMTMQLGIAQFIISKIITIDV